MRLFALMVQWWNRHRTGEKTGAALTLVAILVGVYFGVHTMRQEGAVASRPATPSAAPAVSPQPEGNATPCPQDRGTLRSQALALSCEIITYCATREANAPASTASNYETYEEQSGREATRRYFASLVAIVGRLNAAGLKSDEINTASISDTDQDCDTFTSEATAIAQLADRLRTP